MKAESGSIIVVDDCESNREVLTRHLELEGYSVTQTTTGEHALERIAQQSFDIVLLDVMMPGLSGLEVLQRIRQNHDSATLPVVMVTAKDSNQDIVEAFQLGANDYITKPINFPVALARIANQVEHRRARFALLESETRYALAARGANDGLWDWDLRTNEVYFSPRWKEILGYTEEEIGSELTEWYDRIHPEDLAAVQEGLDKHRRGETEHFESEHRVLHKDKRYRWVLSRGLAFRNPQDQPIRMAGSLSDITGGKVADPLTGLPNRILFLDRLRRSLDMAQRKPDYQFAVLFLDLDRFKVVNDSLGHVIGDQLLVAIASRLETCLRETDTIAHWHEDSTVARLGGDEFTILLDNLTDPNNATAVADRILSELSFPFQLDGHEVFTSASIGITIGNSEYHSPEDLLRDADTAMYSAKAQGKARYDLFDSGMRAQAIARLELETSLRRGIERQEFVLYYQPIQYLESGTLIGFEALLRWNHPERGIVLPAEFVPIAEETGLIIPLGWWILREATHQLREWHREYPALSHLMISVNIASKQFLLEDLDTQIQQLLKEVELAPCHLKLEVTESSIMQDPESTAAILGRLRDLGIRIGVDDFGTGYSSLSYLQRFPIDTLKIDRSFVLNMETTDENQQIVQSIVDLAHNLTMDVVAEGVETPAQRELLKTLGCEYGQGYLFAKPLDTPSAAKLLRERIPPTS